MISSKSWKTKTMCDFTPWVTKDIKIISKQKQKLYEIFLKCRYDSEEKKYETYKNFESTKCKTILSQTIILDNETISYNKGIAKKLKASFSLKLHSLLMIKLLLIMKLFWKKVNTTLSDGSSPINNIKEVLFPMKINKTAELSNKQDTLYSIQQC